MKRTTTLLAACAFISLAALARGQSGDSPWIAPDSALLAGTDDLGRSLPSYAETGGLNAGRYVGMFYWQWHTGLRAIANQYDMTEYLKTQPKEMDYSAHPRGGPNNPTYYWGEPILGYYRSTDPWVMRKHLSMFGQAGLDFLFLDYNNSSIYDPELATFLKIRDELTANGSKLPRITFFLNFQPEKKIEALYTEWYKPHQHDDTWFRFRGKPLLMVAMPTDASKLKNPALLPEIQAYFTWRPTWALEKPNKTPGMWRFMDGPIPKTAIGPDGAPEQIVVNKSMGGPIWGALRKGSVSETPTSSFTADDYVDSWSLPSADQGIFFQYGWDQALKVAPPILLVTGWNEWTASVWETPGVVMVGRKTVAGQGHIVDEYNKQFDRDLEPVRGSYGDNYYMQFLENFRKYKGLVRPQPVHAPKGLSLDSNAAAWAGVTPVYHDKVGDAANRDFDSNVAGIHYTNTAARNDIATAQMADEGSAVLFRVTTAAPLSPTSDANWMELLVDTDANAATGWRGFDLLINRSRDGATASIEKYNRSVFGWTKIANASFHVDGNVLTLAVPRSALGSSSTSKFNFKWIDNQPAEPTLDSLYTDGDTAPDGRQLPLRPGGTLTLGKRRIGFN